MDHRRRYRPLRPSSRNGPYPSDIRVRNAQLLVRQSWLAKAMSITVNYSRACRDAQRPGGGRSGHLCVGLEFEAVDHIEPEGQRFRD